MLDSMVAQGKIISERSNKFGQEKVDYELQTARDDFNEWQKQLTEAASMLDKCMTLSDSFDSLYEPLSRWIGERDVSLKMEVGLLATEAEKMKKLNEMHALRQEVLGKQGDLDKVNMHAQQLVQVHADLRVPHRMAQLSTRYQALVTLTAVSNSDVIIIKLILCKES